MPDVEMEDVWEEVDNTRTNETAEPRRRGRRGDVSYIRSDTFSGEQKKSLKIPCWFCAVCCRILYEDEVYPMSVKAERVLTRFLESKNMTWPVLQYRDEHGDPIPEVKRRNNRIAVCASHKSSGNNSVDRIKEFVSNYDDLLRRVFCRVHINLRRMNRWNSLIQSGVIPVTFQRN